MMKRLLTAALIISLLIGGLIEAKNNSMKVSPAKPKADDEVTVTFNPAGTKLAKADKIEMTAYSYSNKIDNAAGIEMTRKGNLFTAKFPVSPEAVIVGVKFSQGETTEANDGKGYMIKIYKDGKETDAALAAAALAPATWGRYFGVKTDMKAAYANLQKLFKQKPELKEKNIKDYLTVVNSALKEKGKDIIEAELKKIEQKKDLTEDDYSLIQRMYSMLKMTDKANEIKKAAIAKFPKGSAAASQAYMAVYQAKELDKKIEAFESFVKEFPGSSMTSGGIYIVASSMIKDKKYPEAAAFVKKYMNDLDGMYLGAIAGMFAKENQELETAAALGKLALDKAEKDIKATDKKPPYMTAEEYAKSKKISLAEAQTTYAELCSLNGKKEEAIKLYEEALPVLVGDYEDPEVNTKYVKTLFEANMIDKASKEVESLIVKFMPNEATTKLAKEIYIKKNGSDAGFDKYIEKLTKDSKEYLAATLKKEMINEPAPKFTLKDLKGKEVSLASLKGKVVIVDFWATWCGFCIKSFPGMQQVVNKYANDKDVAILFLDTWESSFPTPEAKNKAVSEFLEKNKYNFYVLMDYTDKVVESYGVSGIPTKFIIDKKGNIRLKAVGFDGNTDKLIEELSLMIDMLK